MLGISESIFLLLIVGLVFLYGMTFPELALQYFERLWLLHEYSKVKYSSEYSVG